MRVAVTGASGHIGGVLVRELLARGDEVSVLIQHEDAALAGLSVERHFGDIRDRSALRRAFAGAEIIFHLAARVSIIYADARETHSVNVEGPRAVCDIALEVGARRLVHFSSIHAFDDRPHHVPVDERRPPPRGLCFPPYDRSKAAGARAVLDAVERGLDAVIVNPTGVIGPFDFRPSPMGQVLLDLYHGRLLGTIEGGFDWVDVRDVVKSALAAAERGRTGEMYLLPGRWVSVRETARIASSITGRPVPRFHTPMLLARALAPFAELGSVLLGRKPSFTVASVRALRANRHISGQKAIDELGHSARPYRDSLADAYSWFSSHNLL